VRIRAEDVKAKPGTGGRPCWLTELDNPAKKGKSHTTIVLGSLKDWLRGKVD